MCAARGTKHPGHVRYHAEVGPRHTPGWRECRRAVGRGGAPWGGESSWRGRERPARRGLAATRGASAARGRSARRTPAPAAQSAMRMLCVSVWEVRVWCDGSGVRQCWVCV
eukprot:3874149-Rhodomonas_salina.2